MWSLGQHKVVKQSSGITTHDGTHDGSVVASIDECNNTFPTWTKRAGSLANHPEKHIMLTTRENGLSTILTEGKINGFKRLKPSINLWLHGHDIFFFVCKLSSTTISLQWTLNASHTHAKNKIIDKK